MKKVLDFVEGYVQWIALGLGVLFLGYCIYAYGVQTPVMVAGVGPTPLNPGDVDATIRDGVANRVDAAMHDTNVPKMTVPHFVDSFMSELDLSSYTPVPFPIIVDSPTVVPPSISEPNRPTQSSPPITELPTIAAAKVLDYSSGRSNVQLAGANQPPQGGPPVAAVVGGVDKSWVTVRYSISPKGLDAAFAKANIPGWSNRTAFLQVDLYRAEQLPSGQWSKPQLIPPLNAAMLNAYPADELQAELDYLAWAPGHVIDLLQPPFLTVNRGDPWVMPGQAPAVAAALPPLDPTKNYSSDTLMKYSKADRLAYAQAHSAFEQQQQQKNRRPSAPTPPPGYGGRGGPPPGIPGGPRGVVEDSEREKAENGLPYYAPPPNYHPITPPVFFQPPGMPPPGAFFPNQAGNMPPGFYPNSPIAPAQTAPNAPPPSEFDPKQIVGDIIGWQHDITVEPGHTYRYMVVYRIKNPIFNTNAAKNKPELEKVFALISPDSNWTVPISIATSTNFFVASNSARGASVARFKVFKWENGSQREHDFDVAPGDVIGAKESVGDFGTGWTLVALRFDDPRNPDEMTVVVMGPQGQIIQRDYRSDQAKPELQTLLSQAAQASAADATGNAANGVAPNGGALNGGPLNAGGPPGRGG